MNISLLDKLLLIIKYMFSSILPIVIFVVSLLLLIILIINVKKKNKIVSYTIVGMYIGFLVGVVITYTNYVQICVNGFVKGVLNYVYFPSSIVYFFIILFVTVLFIYTIFSSLSSFKKILNYLVFSILYLLFIFFVVISSINGLDLSKTVILYKNDTVLSIVQLSNLLLVIWIVFTFFYKLFLFFKSKFDK